MTRVNSEVKIVSGLFVGPEYATQVWISETAAEAMNLLGKTREGVLFSAKLRHYARAGFCQYISKHGPIRYEWAGVYRVAHKASLFRLIGFFEGRNEFIAIDAFDKGGQKLSSAERGRINAVAAVKASGKWKKRAPT